MKKTTIGLIAVTSALLLGQTVAYFADDIRLNTKGTSGTVAVELNTTANLKDASGFDIFAPGEIRDAGFEVVNMGNKSIDVRSSVALTVESQKHPLLFTGDTNTQSEYDLYRASDVEYVVDEGYKPIAGAKPLQTKTIQGSTILYQIDEYSLNGNSEKYGTDVETINQVTKYKQAGEYVVLFKSNVDKTWQDSSLTLDVVVEAKQHENTNAGWDLVAKETIKQGVLNKDAAVHEDVITK